MMGLFFLRFSFSAFKYLKKQLYITLRRSQVFVNIFHSCHCQRNFINARENKTGIHATDFTSKELPKVMLTLKHVTLVGKKDRECIC